MAGERKSDRDSNKADSKGLKEKLKLQQNLPTCMFMRPTDVKCSAGQSFIACRSFFLKALKSGDSK